MNDTISTEQVLIWKADNVADWLTTIGLEKYVNKFKRYMVTGPVLLQLDDTLLDDFDITSTIDRKTLLESVGHFTGNIEDCLTKESSSTGHGECKATKFPAGLPELLPTIGEEEELEVKEKNECNEPLIFTPHEDTRENDQRSQSSEDEKEPIKSATDKKEAHLISPEDMASVQTESLSSPITKDIEEVASRATQMVQIFSEENMSLRNQLDKYCQELRNLHNVKKELHNAEIMYKDLKGAFINREHKEKAMCMRLEAEITQLQNTNAELTEELREAQDIISTREKDELKNVQEEINKRDDVVKQLQKERKISNTSLHNLERMLKQKSSEIINLQRQLEKFRSNENRSYMGTKEIQKEKDIKEDNKKLDQSRKSVPRCYCRGTRFSPKSIFPNQKSEFDVPTCVSVLIELLKEKDTEIANMREEIKQMESRLTNGTKENNWLKNRGDEMHMISNEVTVHNNTETYVQYRNDEQRYCDLETAIKTLHVQLAEKNAAIKILQCKYGENGVGNCQDSSSIISTPFRSPSFTSQGSSTSSYQDSGIVTSDCHNGDTSHQNIKDFKVETFPLIELEIETKNDQRSSTEQEEDQAIDHCWFV